MRKTVIIAAAGVGSRLGAGMPKCLVPVNGHAVFEYQLRALSWADEIRMVVGYKADEVINQVSAIVPNVVFIRNNEFATTNLRQSYYLGAQGLNEKALFLDGDTIISRTSSDLLLSACEEKNDFIAITHVQTASPIYAGVQGGTVQWFSYNKRAEYELANAAFLSPLKLEYENTLFYLQLEKHLPTKALMIDCLEVDTLEDLHHAEQAIMAQGAEYNFWRE